MQVNLWPAHLIDNVWPHVREGFERATAKTGGDLDTAALWTGCRRGDYFLIVAVEGEEIRAASIWKPETWTSGKKLRCMAVYGRKMADWKDEMREVATRIARDCGATSFIADARLGWVKALPKTRIIRVVLEETI